MLNLSLGLGLTIHGRCGSEASFLRGDFEVEVQEAAEDFAASVRRC
jgi:hypothetical protein